MTNEIIFYTQVASILGFIIALFVLYRVLVANKDSVIELKNERILGLEEKNRMLEKQMPDALTDTLSRRVDIMKSEVARLREDGEKKQEAIDSKGDELIAAETKLSTILDFIKDTDVLCPECDSVLIKREYYTLTTSMGGRDVDADVEYLEYQCGLAINHMGECAPCEYKR